MKILIPREAWPSAIAASLSSDSAGVNSIAPSALSGTATTHRARSEHRAVAASRPRRGRRAALIAATGVAEPVLERRPRRRSRSSSARVPPAIVTRPPVNCVSSRL